MLYGGSLEEQTSAVYLGTIDISHIHCCHGRSVLSYYGNQIEMSVTPLFKVKLSSHLVWSFLGMKGISTYLIAMVTQLPWQPE